MYASPCTQRVSLVTHVAFALPGDYGMINIASVTQAS